MSKYTKTILAMDQLQGRQEGIRDYLEHLEFQAWVLAHHYRIDVRPDESAIQTLIPIARDRLRRTHAKLNQLAHEELPDPGAIMGVSQQLYWGLTRGLQQLDSNVEVPQGALPGGTLGGGYILSFGSGPPSGEERGQAARLRERRSTEEPRELRRQVFNGVVKSIEGTRTVVLLECEGQRQRRTMSTEALRRNGIRHEGQALTIVTRERRRADGGFRTEVDIDPVGSPAKRSVKPVRPGTDFSKFKDMG